MSLCVPRLSKKATHQYSQEGYIAEKTTGSIFSGSSSALKMLRIETSIIFLRHCEEVPKNYPKKHPHSLLKMELKKIDS